MGPGGYLEGSWRPLGAHEEAWSAKGRLPGVYGALLDASWPALGAVRARKTLPSIASWPVQEEFRDWFHLSRGSKMGPGEESKKEQKRDPVLERQNLDFKILLQGFYCFFQGPPGSPF